jgi:sec-independent protein translocase protein TatA
MNGTSILLAFVPSPMAMLILGVLAVLLFGDRLPEVAKSVGKGLSEFKKGLRDVEQELRSAIDSPTSSSSSTLPSSTSTTQTSYDEAFDHDEATAPKFEPPSSPAPSQPAPAETTTKTVEG